MSDHIQIGDISPRVQYVGTSTETTFTYTFPIFKDVDLEVYIDGVVQTLATDYSITGAGVSSGGEVTFVVAPATDEKVTLVRRLAIQRTSDFQASGEFRAKVINDELDFQTAALQQIEDDLSRALKLKRDDAAATLELPLVAERANKLIGFDDQGNAELSNLTITEMEQGATGPAGPNGPTGPAGMDGVFSGAEATVVPELDDKLAVTDASDSDAPKFATVESILGAMNLLSDDGANLSPDNDWVMYFDTSSSLMKKMHPEDIGGGGGGLQSVQIFNASGTWTKPTGITLIKVTVVGGGGGGGKAGGGTNRGNGGGGAGGAAIEWIDVSALGSSVAVTIAAGGTGAISGNTSGSPGGTSSFGSYCSATGGGGGETENTGGTGGVGGAGSGGNINIGGGGGGGMGQTGDYTGSGTGGNSIFGGGGFAYGGAEANLTGQAGTAPGGGGAGGSGTNPGGNGAAGIIIVEEYAS